MMKRSMILLFLFSLLTLIFGPDTRLASKEHSDE